MIIKKLSLINYKNFEQLTLEFDSKINCFVGKNGIGKTNVLDAIYHLAFGKSYFNPVTSQNIKHEEEFFMLEGEFLNGEKEERIITSFKRGHGKLIKRNGKEYEKISDHIGTIPLVIISPTDRDLIVEGSETRRKFMDGVIAQGDKLYLNTLLKYNKIVSQRNALLKYFAVNRTFDETSLEVYDDQIIEFGEIIFEKRQQFIKEFKPILKKRYQEISNSREDISLTYKSQFNNGESFKDVLNSGLKTDLQRQFSNFGTHKDDLIFKIKSHSVKKFGSQGQQKSYLVALKFAQYDFLKSHYGVKPILLLDDIFDKLDEDRVSKIVKMVTDTELGQMCISDTHPERTESVVKKNTNHYKMINLEYEV
ncbi:DNA replication/repair protein RecF [Psychroflexus sp. MES1-P1E]|uniref:DNA replication/repair protein RecF n=1 Tax=Psychroflexus sp. MES1-P1E TaxID=2058320 RepID=UPI000C7A361E|nr:DNA replication and repair protein RecF [Psychroflexus sp. MES1-P1E]PKG41830.1 DNA replication and repair protein RecF [Psychroflexus sp. MES1-P1E]